RNVSPARRWLDVQVVGKQMNRMGIGARVRVDKPDRSGERDALLGLQEVNVGYGYASGQPAICHFGLGKETKADVQVTFPSGKIVRKKSVPANQRLRIEEPTDD
ncbi:MAG: ASPIC/UnbV domain-containing protein, partial [Planctomycetales bacterium]